MLAVKPPDFIFDKVGLLFIYCPLFCLINFGLRLIFTFVFSYEGRLKSS